jgi:hypothetical protein
MSILLFDRGDRLGSNISNYLAQIFYAHKKKYIINFRKNGKASYQYYSSIFVRLLFDFIDQHNADLKKKEEEEEEYKFEEEGNYILTIAHVLQTIECDYFTYFQKHVYSHIMTSNIYNHNIVPFDVNKTILVHLRLDDMAYFPDYDGSTCANYYKQRLESKERCDFIRVNNNNSQSPLSKQKIENIINLAKSKYTDHEVILLTSPMSNTSFLSYPVIKNQDESFDLYLLTICKVVVLSRSTFALCSLLFTDLKEKEHVYAPLWGHLVCLGLDSIYDQTDKSKFTYFS